jgi:uncharacterized protein (DUF1499 family)
MSIALRVAIGLAILAVVLLALAGPSYRTGLFELTSAFAMMGAAAVTGVAALLVAVGVGWAADRRRDRMTRRIAAAAFVVALFAVSIPLNWLRMARNAPPIHDIATDLANPPQFEAIVPLRADAPNTLERTAQVDTQQREGYADIAPVTLPQPPDQVFDRALAVVQDNGWEIVTADRTMGRLEATATTRWFGFKDDIVVRLTPWGSGTRVDVRSVSRLGLSDVGTNARRIRRFLSALQAF